MARHVFRGFVEVVDRWAVIGFVVASLGCLSNRVPACEIQTSEECWLESEKHF